MDIADLGPNQGAEAGYNWKWYHNTPSLALWLVLAAALILIKANRTPRILLILVPLLIVKVLWFLLIQMMDFRSPGDVEMFNMMFNSLIAGITFLWLFAPKLGRFNPWIVFFLAFALISMFFFARQCILSWICILTRRSGGSGNAGCSGISNAARIRTGRLALPKTLRPRAFHVMAGRLDGRCLSCVHNCVLYNYIFHSEGSYFDYQNIVYGINNGANTCDLLIRN